MDRKFQPIKAILSLGAALSLAPLGAAHAQVYVGPPHFGDDVAALCVEDQTGAVIYTVSGGDCGDISSDPTYLAVGPNLEIYFDAVDGSASFDGAATFNGATTFNGNTSFAGNIIGPVTMTGTLQAAGVTSTSGMSNTGNFTNTGNVTVTGSLGAASITSSGGGTFTGALSSSQLTTGSISATNVGASGNVTVGGFLQGNNGASILGTTQLATVQVFQNLSVQSGATVDMNGNRITEVGTPTSGTDAVNKNYVDGLTGSAQATADTALANAAVAQTTAETARAEAAVAQTTADSGVARTGALGTGAAAALGGGATYNPATGALSAPSYSIAGESYGNVGAAFAAVDDRLELLDSRLGVLSDTTDRGFRRANAGIATALALGGTMIVPDSTVSVSFNLATYRGEQGFSGALVVQAAPKVYISGGFAGSTVKGSTGGRVGVAFGL